MTCNGCAGATDFDPMGTYEPEIHMNASRLIGFEKDGSPVFVTMAEPTSPINLLGTAAFIASGAALGWLVASAVVGYMKK